MRSTGNPGTSRSGVAAGSIRVGCAGWSIPGVHAAHFGPGPSHLARYAMRFDIAEINSSFYRSHAASTYARWAGSVPASFRFSVKLPKAITHDARLQSVGPLVTRFAREVDGLGNRLGGVLVQLPPTLAFDARIANAFFSVLRRRISARVACEPRHASWFDPRVDPIWARHDVTRVAADPAVVPMAACPGGAGRWTYWRWHGSPRLYYDAYDDRRLQALARALIAHARRTRAACMVFDNTAGGHAIADAVRLQDFLQAIDARSSGRPAGRRSSRCIG